MANAFELPLCAPLRFFQQTELTGVLTTSDIDLGGFYENYNYKPFDRDFFVRLIKDWEECVEYNQKFQRGDVVPIYWHTPNDATDYSINILDTFGNIVLTISSGSLTSTFAGSVQAIYYKLPMYDLADGRYFAQIKYARSGEDLFVISEPFEVKETWENTVLIDYTHSSNDHNILFKSTELSFQIRVDGVIVEPQFRANVETYENQPLNQVLLNGTPFREWKLYLGGKEGLIPDWIADKINRALCCDSVRIDDTYYTVTDEGGLEPNRTKDYPLAQWSVDLRERYNKDSVEIDGVTSVDYSFGQMPTAERFYLEKLVVNSASVSVEKEFSSKNGFISYLDNYFTNTQSLTGRFYINSENELIYQPGSSTDQTWLNSNSPTLGGLLTNWLAFGIDTDVTPTLEFTTTVSGANDAVYWGDGTKRNYSSAGGTKTYTAQGIVTCYYYFKAHPDLTVSTTTNDGVVSILGGDITTTLTELIVSSEKVKFVDNSLLLLGNGTFDTLNLQSNSLPVTEINKIIIMLQEAVNVTKTAASSGTATLNLQAISAPPSGGSMTTIVRLLSNSWTLTTD